MRRVLVVLAFLCILPVAISSCSAGDPAEDPRLTLGETSGGLTKCQDPGAVGNNDFCNDPACVCTATEGDCDSHAQCTTGFCGTDNGPQFGMKPGHDVCVPFSCANGVQDAGETGVDCGTAQCGACVTCTAPPGSADFCSRYCLCTSGQGDCDDNSECASGLVCGLAKGVQFGLPSGHDACVAPHCVNGVQDGGETGVDCGGPDCGSCIVCPANNTASTCSATCRCPSGWGDCDGNGQCATGLVCGTALGGQFGLNPTFDVCVASHCTNGVMDGGETGIDCGGADCGTCPVTGGSSCPGSSTNRCGPTGAENCCLNRNVPGGTYKRSFDNVVFTDGNNPATITEFDMNKYEVTVRRFRNFVNAFSAWRSAGNPAAGAGAHPLIAGSGWQAAWPLAADAATLAAGLACDPATQTWTGSAGGNEERPINCVNWYEAFAFCLWDGGRLPTEAEWNFAASGGPQQRVRAWSNPATSDTISTALASYGCVADGSSSCAVTDLVNVGIKSGGNGRWVHADLQGNVWEWTLDFYNATYPNPCTNCAQLTESATRVVRGGAFSSPAAGGAPNLRAGIRQRVEPHVHGNNVGIRCARD
jgi:formylglycine-generating enzyme